MSWRLGAVLLLFVLAGVASFTSLGLFGAELWANLSPGGMLTFVADFFPPDLSPEMLRQVWRGLLETLAISLIGTLLAALAGLLLAWFAAGQAGLLARLLTRSGLNVLRAVPELVWGALMVLFAGLGPFAGTLALALHTAGVLGRLFAETLENTPTTASDALVNAGAGRTLAFLYGSLPLALPQLLSYVLYRWENNIRIAAVLGFVGAGGLGQLMYVNLSLFRMPQAATVLLAMLILVLLVDGCSQLLRRFLATSAQPQ